MPHPFPFFGAGAARYSERAGIAVRFFEKPAPPAQKKIIALAPGPIRPEKKSFVGTMLAAHSTQPIDAAIQRSYGRTKDAARAFDAAVEEWLLKIHALCPIELVHRAPDLEAGGTKLSAWHKTSLAAIPALLEAWRDDETIATQSTAERRLFASCAHAIIAYGDVAPSDLPPSLQTLFPYEFLRGYFAAKDQRSADAVIKSLPDSRPALAAVTLGMRELRKAQNLKEQIGFLYFIRTLVDAKSIDSSLHASLIFDIFYAAMHEGDDEFANTFAKLIARSDNKLVTLERFADWCNGIRAGYGMNKPNPKLAAKLAQALLTVPLTKAEKASCAFLERLRQLT